MHERDQYAKQVERLTASQTLRSSESLCRLLRYLAAYALEHPGEPLKEYQIAVEAFGRPPDFDPQLDSTIRVQAGRLRQKLAEYYAGEGAEDSILVELPKGTHTLAFHPRGHGSAKFHAGGEGEPLNGHEFAAAPDARSSWWLSKPVQIGVLALMVVAVALGLIAIFHHPATAVSTSAVVAPPPALTALDHLWRPFLADPEEPIVVYSNALFVGRPETGLRYYQPGRDSPDHIFDQYTGVGEVMAVHDLDDLFARFEHRVVVKRGELFTLDDVQDNNLIFIGSPSENLTLREIPGTEDFVFHRMTTGPRKGDLAILNVDPNPGEQSAYLASPSDQPMTRDYAVVALMHALNPAHWVMILAGTTTFGTQGAVQYVSQEANVKDLLLRLSVDPTGALSPFEALLQIEVTKGVPVQEKLLSVRERPSQ